MAEETQEVETPEIIVTQKEVVAEILKHKNGQTEKQPEEKKENAVETKNEKTPETKDPEKVEPPKETPVPPKSLDEMIAERTGGKYKTYGDFEKYANRAERKLSERIIKLAELEEKGVDIENVIKYESKGYDKLNPEKSEDAKKLLFEKWSEEDKGITQKELEFKFKREYGILNKADEDLTDDEKEEKEVSQIALTRSAKAAQQFLIDKRKEYELPKYQATNTEPTESEVQKLVKEWTGQVTPVVNDYKEEIFSVTEGKDKKDFKFVITDEERKNTLNTMIDPSSMVQRHIKEGKTDLNGLRRTAFIVENFDKILSSYGQSRYDAGKKEVVEGIENPSNDTRAARALDGNILNPAQAAVADRNKRTAGRV